MSLEITNFLKMLLLKLKMHGYTERPPLDNPEILGLYALGGSFIFDYIDNILQINESELIMYSSPERYNFMLIIMQLFIDDYQQTIGVCDLADLYHQRKIFRNGKLISNTTTISHAEICHLEDSFEQVVDIDEGENPVIKIQTIEVVDEDSSNTMKDSDILEKENFLIDIPSIKSDDVLKCSPSDTLVRRSILERHKRFKAELNEIQIISSNTHSAYVNAYCESAIDYGPIGLINIDHNHDRMSRQIYEKRLPCNGRLRYDTISNLVKENILTSSTIEELLCRCFKIIVRLKLGSLKELSSMELYKYFLPHRLKWFRLTI